MSPSTNLKCTLVCLFTFFCCLRSKDEQGSIPSHSESNHNRRLLSSSPITNEEDLCIICFENKKDYSLYISWTEQEWALMAEEETKINFPDCHGAELSSGCLVKVLCRKNAECPTCKRLPQLSSIIATADPITTPDAEQRVVPVTNPSAYVRGPRRPYNRLLHERSRRRNSKLRYFNCFRSQKNQNLNNAAVLFNDTQSKYGLRYLFPCIFGVSSD